MQTSWILVALLLLAGVGYVLGRRKAMASADGNIRNLHSLPGFYGWNVALLVIIPSVTVLAIWLFVQPVVVNRAIVPMVTSEQVSGGAVGLVMSDVRRIASGLDAAVSRGLLTADAARNLDTGASTIRQQLSAVGTAVGSEISPEVLSAAQRYREMTSTGTWAMTIAVILAALGGAYYALRQTDRDFRARNFVEIVVRGILIFAATIAIMTTVGIAFSLIFNTIKFFGLHPASDFLFGTTWAPLFGG